MGEHANRPGSGNSPSPSDLRRQKILEGEKRKWVATRGCSPRMLGAGLALLVALALGVVGIVVWPREQPPVPTPSPTGGVTPTLTQEPTAPAGSTEGKTVTELYNEGKVAYAAQHWPEAYHRFSAAYREDPAYEGLTEILGATCYNWGVATLNGGPEAPLADLELAREHFEEARFFNPQHPLAEGRIAQLRRFAEASAGDQEPTTRIKIFETLLEELQANPDENEAAGLFTRVVNGDLLSAYQDQATAQITAGDEALAAKSYARARSSYEAAIATLEKASALSLEQASEATTRLAEARAKLEDVPDTPEYRYFRASLERNFSRDGNIGEAKSCVAGRVVDSRGRGIEGAVLKASNGQVTPETTSIADGQYKICYLGADRWQVALHYIPGSPPLANNPPPSATFEVNGSEYHYVLVNFIQR